MTALPERWQGVAKIRPGVSGVPMPLLPDPYASYEEWARRYHHDLPELDDLSLWAETRRLEYAIAVSGCSHMWLTERLQVLNAEAERRRRAQGGDK